ncbi:hypothetical protein BDY19DRAFT_507415 [Irpex rosettiformis]|uniref:Uncharacterized protein n=1 Tax=Irpex rosettiformis TaxID=378272 RepID=A0ACB8UEK4_9APHY|nr:hypothetical protein BDY19DRAFT_507415 [Irpex rosettiformis]
MVISSDSEEEAAPVLNEVEVTISPALSYITLDDHAPGAVSTRGTAAQPIAEDLQPQRWNPYDLEGSEGSDEDSSTDEDEGRSVHPTPIIREEPSEMDLIVERLLAGEESRVDKILKDIPLEQRRRVQECLKSTGPSRSRRRVSNHSSSENESFDTSSSEEESSSSEDEPQVIDRSKKRPHVRNRVPRANGRKISHQSAQASQSLAAEDGGITVVLPKAHRARGRRLLVPQNRNLPIAAIYMRGDVQFIRQNQEGVRYRISAAGVPAYESGQHRRKVTDAILLDDRTAVVSYELGHAQVSCVILDEDHSRHVDLAHRGHSTVVEHKVKGTSSKNPGIYTLAALSHSTRQFLSGGGDGTIRLWTLRTGRRGEMTGTSTHLWEDYFLPIRCVAYTHASGKVLFGSSKSIYTRDLSGAKLSEEKAALSTQPPTNPRPSG